MASRISVCVAVVFLASSITIEGPSRLIVWNVGQGLWSTVIQDNHCWHFDTGGEFINWKMVKLHCRARFNLISFSHWDWDHIGFARLIPRHLPNSCVLLPPEGKSSRKKERVLSRLKHCTVAAPFPSHIPQFSRTTNGMSRVIFWRGILFPGDSGQKEERQWLHHLPIAQTKILILGHHGSRSSTSNELLSRLRSARMGVVSARFKRYGHPHLQTLERLEQARLPVLRTEDWGTLVFEL